MNNNSKLQKPKPYNYHNVKLSTLKIYILAIWTRLRLNVSL